MTEKGKTYGSDVTADRVTDQAAIADWSDFHLGASAIGTDWTSFFEYGTQAQVFLDAYQSSKEETPLMVNRDIFADSWVGGYSGKIAMLVSNNCISACDEQAAELSRSHRAVLVGTPTNGTGLGLFGEDSSHQWTDWRGFITAEIPADMFGVALKPWGPDIRDHILDFNQYEDDYLIENRPTNPDQLYEPTAYDLIGRDHGWEPEIVKALGYSAPIHQGQ